ncbi:MAG: ABC transporter ATP-binding protein [Thermoleophilaceae bacterium]|nr:ABC transporter ATP-binding protein [Thermoleophilaceae bacterium]
MSVLECRNLTKRFGSFTALSDVSLSVEAGEVVAIAGPNGAGKTTLLAILAGIHSPSAGQMDLHSNGLGWVPQRAATYGKLSVRENLALFARLERVADIGDAVDTMLDRIGLADRADTRAEELSGGMRQRLSIGVGLIADPAVLLLDEPSAALDPLQRVRIWEFLSALAEHGIAIVFSTHTGQEVDTHADRVLVLDRGATVVCDAPATVTGGESFETAFVDIIEKWRKRDAPSEAVSA